MFSDELRGLCYSLVVTNTLNRYVWSPESRSCVFYYKFGRFNWLNASSFCSNFGQKYGVKGRLVFILNKYMINVIKQTTADISHADGVLYNIRGVIVKSVRAFIGLRSKWNSKTTAVQGACKDPRVFRQWAWYDKNKKKFPLNITFPKCEFNERLLKNTMSILWLNVNDIIFADGGLNRIGRPICELWVKEI